MWWLDVIQKLIAAWHNVILCEFSLLLVWCRGKTSDLLLQSRQVSLKTCQDPAWLMDAVENSSIKHKRKVAVSASASCTYACIFPVKPNISPYFLAGHQRDCKLTNSEAVFQFHTLHIPDVTKGYKILLDVLACDKRFAGFIPSRPNLHEAYSKGWTLMHWHNTFLKSNVMLPSPPHRRCTANCEARLLN